MEPVIPTNPQKLYPQLDMSSPPLWGQDLPLSPLTPPQDPSGVQALPHMERNPLFVPEQPPSCLLPDLMLLGAMPPGLVMNPLTQQLILAQQQALSQQLSASMPQVPFHHQVHPNNIMPANFMTGFQNFSPHNFNNMSAPFGHFNEGQFDSNETWNANEEDDAEWKRDLMLKEKRILRDKYGDNHMNILTDRPTNKPTHHFQTDPQETENMSPLVPNSPEPEKCDSSFQCETQTHECHTEERICYPSLPLNSSDEEPSNTPLPIKDNETTKILPAFLSRMKNSNINQSHPVPPPPHDTSYTTLFNNQTIQTQNSTETHETHSFNDQQTNQYNIETHETYCFNEQQTNHYSIPQNAPRDLPLFPSPPTLPIYYPPTSDITWTPNKPILYPPEHISNPAPIRPVTKHPREIKRPPLDTSRSPSPLKPCKREISYPPGLEPSTSPKKQIIFYPPADHKRIRYPPHKDIIRQPSTACFPNKSSSFHFNNESSFTGDKEILYPHSWTEALSPMGSPVREIHYPPRPAVPSNASFGDSEVPDIPEETGGEVTPPIQDSSDNEEIPGTRSCPLESTPIKKPHISNTEDKPDLDSDLGGFETPTEID